jgi:dipeptidyl aminopeptidase/acylaminoacyl peptidase
MKKFILAAAFLAAMPASAYDISYPVFGETSPQGFEVTINTITEKITYDCVFAVASCSLESSTTTSLHLVPLKEIKRNELPPAPPAPVPTTYKPPVPAKKYPQFDYPADAQMIVLSPDQKKLAYMENGPGYIKTYNDYAVVFEDGRELHRFGITESGWEVVTDNGKLFEFTDDSSKLVYLDDSSGFQQLYVADLSAKAVNLVGRPLITRPYTVIDFTVHGDEVFYIANRENEFKWNLYSLNIETGKLKMIAENALYTNNLSVAGDHVLFSVMEDGAGAVRSYDTKTGKVVKYSGIEKVSIPVKPTEIIETDAVKGLWMDSASSTKAIIWLHGGPYRQSAIHRHPWGSYATYDWMLDEMVGAGVSVLKLEYPGSFGQGRKYAQSLVGNVGFLDVMAVDKATEFLKEKGKTEIFVFGNSYGGYLALKSIAELPDKIKGAAAVAPVTDWRELVERIQLTPFVVHFGGMPNGFNESLYEQADVAKKLNKIDNPAWIFHGSLDNQVPFAQSEFLLRNTPGNKNVRYFSIMDQYHVISGVTQNEAICGKLAELIGVASEDKDFCKLH